MVNLIGQGKSNGEIAEELVLSKRTVETHVSKILAKLELSHRAQIMRWVIDQNSPDLVPDNNVSFYPITSPKS